MDKLKLANFRINSELWDNFLLYCQRNGTTAKEELTNFIEKKIENKDYSWQAQENKAIADIDLLKEAHEKIALRLERLEQEIEFIRKSTDANQINCRKEEVRNLIVADSLTNQEISKDSQNSKDDKDDKDSQNSKDDKDDKDSQNSKDDKDDKDLIDAIETVIVTQPTKDEFEDTDNSTKLYSDRDLAQMYKLDATTFGRARKSGNPPKKMKNLFSVWDVVETKWKFKPTKMLGQAIRGKLVLLDPNLEDDRLGLYGVIAEIGKKGNILVRLELGEVVTAKEWNLLEII